ncbi:uncharacterized protein LOC142557307 isoform X3 [Dermacentor variabilis]
MAGCNFTLSSSLSCGCGSSENDTPGTPAVEANGPAPPQPQVGDQDPGPIKPATHVTMLFCPLNNPAGSLTAWPFNIQFSTWMSGFRGDSRTLMHWAVAFKFPEEEDFLVCEANRDGLTGELVGHPTWRTAAAVQAKGPRQ